jgi:hypothetical protein
MMTVNLLNYAAMSTTRSVVMQITGEETGGMPLARTSVLKFAGACAFQKVSGLADCFVGMSASSKLHHRASPGSALETGFGFTVRGR